MAVSTILNFGFFVSGKFHFYMSSWPYYTKYRLRIQWRSGVCGYFVREFVAISFGSLLALSARRGQISREKSYSFHFDDSMPFGDFSQIHSVIFPKSIRWFFPNLFGELARFRSVNWHVLVRSNVNISFGQMLNTHLPHVLIPSSLQWRRREGGQSKEVVLLYLLAQKTS